MHVLASLIIFLGFVLVVCLGLVQVIWDLSEKALTHRLRCWQRHLTGPADPKMESPPRVNRRVPGG